MSELHKKTRSGFTVVELLIASVMGVIVILGTSIILMNTQRAFQVTYDKIYADVVTDSFVARRLFDSVIRKSSNLGITIGNNGESVEVKYYLNDESTYPDRYARFYCSGTELNIEKGTISSTGVKQTLTVDTTCDNVSRCRFSNQGNSVRMVLLLDDSERSNLVVTSAFLHNE